MVVRACSPSYSGGWGRRIAWNWEVKIAASRDRTIALWSGDRMRLCLKKTKTNQEDWAQGRRDAIGNVGLISPANKPQGKTTHPATWLNLRQPSSASTGQKRYSSNCNRKDVHSEISPKINNFKDQREINPWRWEKTSTKRMKPSKIRTPLPLPGITTPYHQENKARQKMSVMNWQKQVSEGGNNKLLWVKRPCSNPMQRN